MEFRRIKPEEHVQYTAIRTSVFYSIERRDVRAMSANPLEHSYKSPGVRIGAFEDGGRLVSAVNIIPYTIRINGHEVKMGGIASVVTRPEARLNGYIRRLMQMAFEEMSEAGQTFSYLYPFSADYYRKFGYELCYTHTKASFPIRVFDSFRYPDNIQEYNPGEPWTPFAEVYESFAKDRNLSVVRSEENWNDMLKRDPHQNLEFTYLFYDDAGKAEAYLMYKAAPGSQGYCISIEEACWSSIAGFNSVLGFIGKLSPEAVEVKWNVPEGVNIYSVFGDLTGVKIVQYEGGMNRIVNVPAGLATLQAPRGNGKIKIGVCDSFLPANTGVYCIEWENGNISTVKNGSAADMPDMETTAGTLAQLVTGYLTPEEASYKKGTIIHSGQSAANALFPRKKLFITEAF